MNTILVSSHRRSGTHFLIDSLRKNIEGAHFPNHLFLPADFNLGSLFSKKQKIYDVFIKFLDQPGPIIIKSHLLPEECNLGSPKDKYEELIQEIYAQSSKLYIHRNGKSVLVSLYKFLAPDCTFSEFIRQPNDHIVYEMRSEKSFDLDRVSYWAQHIREWQAAPDVTQISFENLLSNFNADMNKILASLGHKGPIEVSKPLLPRYPILQGIQKKMSTFGVMNLPENSSVRPTKRSKQQGGDFFKDSLDALFFEEQSGALTID
ncbi:MAG: hypothetical protein HQ506_04575 [Candidatus Marinimicrobia bacterium]|nr:hypothetical protein [Candidatus Neomarinimicrobiota bacterium]